MKRFIVNILAITTLATAALSNNLSTCDACRLAMYAGSTLLDPTLLFTTSEHSLAHQAVRSPFIPGIDDLGDGRNHPVNLDGWGFAVYPLRSSCQITSEEQCVDTPRVYKSGDPILIPHEHTDTENEAAVQQFLVHSSQVHSTNGEGTNDDSFLRLHPTLAEAAGDPTSKSHMVLAHVRAQVGGSATDENAHPFHWKGLVFMHNGALSHHSERRPALLDALRPEVRVLIEGHTDSELLFALITNFLPRHKLFGDDVGSASVVSQAELVLAVEATIDLIDKSELGKCSSLDGGGVIHASSLNMVVSNGVSFVASRYRNCALQDPPSLYVAMGERWDGQRMQRQHIKWPRGDNVSSSADVMSHHIRSPADARKSADVRQSDGVKQIAAMRSSAKVITSEADAIDSDAEASSLVTPSILIASEPLSRDAVGVLDWTLVPKNQLISGSLLPKNGGVDVKRTCIASSCDEALNDVFFVSQSADMSQVNQEPESSKNVFVVVGVLLVLRSASGWYRSRNKSVSASVGAKRTSVRSQ